LTLFAPAFVETPPIAGLTTGHIPVSLQRGVRLRASERCEYCRIGCDVASLDPTTTASTTIRSPSNSNEVSDLIRHLDGRRSQRASSLGQAAQAFAELAFNRPAIVRLQPAPICW
jgi:hypothetical protein